MEPVQTRLATTLSLDHFQPFTRKELTRAGVQDKIKLSVIPWILCVRDLN